MQQIVATSWFLISILVVLRKHVENKAEILKATHSVSR